jgi:hypothetical protein
MRWQYFTIIFLFYITIVFQQARSQPINADGTKVGITGLVQGSQFDILVPIWLDEHFSLSPGIGLKWIEDGGTDVAISITPRFFFFKEKLRYAPYIGGRIGILFYKTKDLPNLTDLIVGLCVGGEYFLHDHFSFGAEGQLNLTKSDPKSIRFGNPGKITMNTATAIYATFYF